MHFVGSNSQEFWDKLYKIDYLQIFQAGYFFTKKQIAVVFNKTTIVSFVYPARLASIIWKKELQTSKISSRAIKQPFNKSLPVFTDFFAVNAHPHNPDKRSHWQWNFRTYHASFYIVGCKSTWLSAIKTHWLPVLPAFNAHMRKKGSYR